MDGWVDGWMDGSMYRWVIGGIAGRLEVLMGDWRY